MNKAQASMEYLLVVGLVILVILPSIYIFYSYSHRSNQEIAQSQVNRFGTQIIDAAEEVYYLGGQSKTTLDLTMPEGVKGMEIWENRELVFFMDDGSELAFKSKVRIKTNKPCTDDRCYYNFTNTFYSPGLKKIVVEARGDHVLIREAEDKNEVDILFLEEGESLDISFNEGESVLIGIEEGDQEENHIITALVVNPDSTTLGVQSDPIIITLYIFDSEMVDLDGDGYYDLLVTLNGIENGEAQLTLENIYEDAEQEPEGGEEPGGSGFCDMLNSTITDAYGSQCGDTNYKHVADFYIDGKIDFEDLMVYATNYGNEEWCEQQLQSTANPCEITLGPNCVDLDSAFIDSYGSECGDENYYYIADFCGSLGNPVKDGEINFDDLMVYATNYGNEAWCEEKLKSISNPCGSSPICSNFLDTVFSDAYNSQCGDTNYNPKADVYIDGKVDFEDLMVFATNYGNEEWCEQQLQSTANPCEPSPICLNFLNTIFTDAYGSQCGDTNYNPKADVYIDGKVDFEDLMVFGTKYGDEAWCEQQSQSTKNPCEITLGPNCIDLNTAFIDSYGSECEDDNYYYIADFCGYLGDPAKDGKVDFEDLMVFATNYGNEEWCEQQLQSTANPCEPSPICLNFLNTIFTDAYGSQCGDTNYNPKADVYIDGKVDFEDLMVFGTKYGDEAWCEQQSQSTKNPCEITLGPNCIDLNTAFIDSYGSECEDDNYYYIADFCGYLGDPAKDGKVDFEDLMVFATNYGNEEWCEQQLQSTANPCEPSPICLNFLNTIFTDAYGSQCGDTNYNPKADVYIDGKVDFEDLMVFATNYGNEEWCEQQLQSTANPCEPSPICLNFLNTIFTDAYGSQCGDTNYNPKADVYIDGKVDFEDLMVFGTKYGDEAWCEQQSQSTKNPCEITLGPNCIDLNTAFIDSWGSECGDTNYYFMADFCGYLGDPAKDGKVDFEDLMVYATNYGNETWCEEKLGDASNPCG